MARSFFGGVHPRGFKELSCEAPIVPLRPKLVSIAMSQHIGKPCTPLVKVGDRVTLIDRAGKLLPAMAAQAGTSVYELLCRLGENCPSDPARKQRKYIRAPKAKADL